MSWKCSSLSGNSNYILLFKSKRGIKSSLNFQVLEDGRYEGTDEQPPEVGLSEVEKHEDLVNKLLPLDFL